MSGCGTPNTTSFCTAAPRLGIIVLVKCENILEDAFDQLWYTTGIIRKLWKRKIHELVTLRVKNYWHSNNDKSITNYIRTLLKDYKVNKKSGISVLIDKYCDKNSLHDFVLVCVQNDILSLDDIKKPDKRSIIPFITARSPIFYHLRNHTLPYAYQNDIRIWTLANKTTRGSFQDNNSHSNLSYKITTQFNFVLLKINLD